MSRLNFSVKVPSIPKRPKIRKKIKKRASTNNCEKSIQLDTIQETKISDTIRSSYYSFTPESSEPSFKILETYEEFLNLKDLDDIIWKKQSDEFTSDDTEQANAKIDTNEGFCLLKQICADLQCPLNLLGPKQRFEVTSLFQAERAKFSKYDIKTAIIAKRIVDTQDQVAKSRGNSKTGFVKDNLQRGNCNKYKSSSSMGTIDEFQHPSTILNQSLSKTLSNLTSKYGFKRNPVQTKEFEVQIDLLPDKDLPITHSCNTQTDLDVVEETNKSRVINKNVQTTRKTRTQLVQSAITACHDKFINTDISNYPFQERFTQMYEHITENDLFCMEWIDKNLFRVPVNPNTIIVDKKIKDSSESSCQGTSFFEQELTWERQALCS